MSEIIQSFLSMVGLEMPPETFAELMPYGIRFFTGMLLVLGVFWVIISIGKSFAYAMRK